MDVGFSFLFETTQKEKGRWPGPYIYAHAYMHGSHWEASQAEKRRVTTPLPVEFLYPFFNHHHDSRDEREVRRMCVVCVCVCRVGGGGERERERRMVAI